MPLRSTLAALLLTLAAAPAFAAGRPAPTAGVTVLRAETIQGRIRKPSIVNVLARSFRAPTELMSVSLWQAQADAFVQRTATDTAQPTKP